MPALPSSGGYGDCKLALICSRDENESTQFNGDLCLDTMKMILLASIRFSRKQKTHYLLNNEPKNKETCFLTTLLDTASVEWFLPASVSSLNVTTLHFCEVEI